MTMFHGKRRLTAEQVRDVVRRAELLDRQDLETITEDEVGAIASELGISEVALQRALAPMSVPVERTPAWKQPATVAVIAWFGGAGAAIGLAEVVASPLKQPYVAYTALSTLIALTCVSASLGFKARTSLAHRRFQLGNLALWSGFGFAAGTIGYYDLAIPGFVIGTAAAFIGWVATRVVGSAPSAGDSTRPTDSSDAGSKDGWRSRLARLIRRNEIMLWNGLPVWFTRGVR